MATLSQAKALGGIGSILIFIPFVSVVGYILIIVAVKEISDDLKDKTIFTNVVISAVTGIVGALAGGFVIVLGVMASGFTFGFAGIAGLISGLLIAWIALIVSAIFLRRAYDSMAQELGVGTFRTAAILYLIGAALIIVLVGFLVLFIAEILQAVAFFSIPDRPPTQAAGGSVGPMASPSTTSAPSGATKFCVSCGNKLAASATFCNNCGAKQP